MREKDIISLQNHPLLLSLLRKTRPETEEFWCQNEVLFLLNLTEKLKWL